MRGLLHWFSHGSARVWGVPYNQCLLVFEDPVGRGYVKGPLGVEAIVLRPALGDDHRRLEDVRAQNRRFLSPWEASLPPKSTEQLPTLAQYQERCDREVREGTTLPMMVEVDGEVAGLVTASDMVRGALCSTSLGYWLAEKYAGQGIGTFVVAACIDLLIGELGVHRVEINIRPENGPSIGLVRRLGLRYEGVRERYMCIAGRWRDHASFAIDEQTLPEGGLVAALYGSSPSV
ncbi:GNAT family N-acetyltransferase [Gleimia hominis]|uniref:GNAT family N-acetyltransferase n=1 Tax=Gleimia hominis TaxID=595468 RepID=UPI000C80B01C|nr:GNAT family protein [Gleimia hominis]WIK63781.1 GNAT family protein [Gleimia hominis]